MGRGRCPAIVDAHVHAWPPASPGEVAGKRSWADVAAALSLGAVVDRLVVVTPGQPPGDDAWTLDIAGKHSRTVRAVVRAGSLAALDGTSLGAAVAARVVLGDSPREPLDRAVAQVVARGLDVCVQNPTGRWDAVGEWAGAHPGRTFLVDHLGHPDSEAGPAGPAWRSFLDLADRANVVVKMPNLVFFAGSLTRADRLARHLASVLEAFGPGRLLWASDWPNTGEPAYDDVLDTGITLVERVAPGAVEAVFGGNALRLLWAGDAG